MIDFAQEIAALKKRVRDLESHELPAGFEVATAFPASPATGRRVYRSDLNLLCVYNGAQWVTVNEYTATSAIFDVTAIGLTGRVTVSREYKPYYTRYEVSSYVGTTNNGSNYWTAEIRSVNEVYGTATTIQTLNTSADAANTFVRKRGACSTNVPTNYGFIDFYVSTKTGTPGMWTAQTLLYYRLIIP